MDFNAELYCLLHRGSSGDLEYYQRLCLGADRVLELGCGDGRVAQHLAEAGHRVLGVDLHPGMIERAEASKRSLTASARARLDYRVADISQLKVEGLFDRVVLPFTTVFCLSAAEKRSCLEGALRHLRPGGLFALDTYDAQIFLDEDWRDDDDFVPMTMLTHEDAELTIFERTRTNLAEKIADVTYGHQIHSGPKAGEWIEYTIRHHYCSNDALYALLKDVGFGDIEVFGGFDKEPLTGDAERVIITARPPGQP